MEKHPPPERLGLSTGEVTLTLTVSDGLVQEGGAEMSPVAIVDG